jgi:hypothetical protein
VCKDDLEEHEFRWEDNIEIDVEEEGVRTYMEWTSLSPERVY